MINSKMSEIRKPSPEGVNSSRVSHGRFVTPENSLQNNKAEFKGRRSNKTMTVFWVILMVSLVFLGIIFWLFLSRNGGDLKVSYGSGWQAVFLNNEEVYFGKIKAEDGDELWLEKIYYPKDSDLLKQKNVNEFGTEIQLIKRGSELHGPEDLMRIFKDSVVYIESLRDDSKISQAIRSYESK